MSTDREFKFTAAHFKLVREKLFNLAGIKLSPHKDAMVYSRLVRRIRALKLKSFDEYFAYLNTHANETESFINALSTNLTSFFREKHHFDALHQYVQRHKRPLTVWSSACSTGEEPYSIAMTLTQANPGLAKSHSIIASDIDSAVLEKARNGVYDESRIENLDPALKKQFFHRGKGNNQGKVKVVGELRRMIAFKQLNLIEDGWSIPQKIDIIFCRNVMIYFDKELQLKIIHKMIKHLHKDSLYIAGHSENFFQKVPELKSIGQTIYCMQAK